MFINNAKKFYLSLQPVFLTKLGKMNETCVAIFPRVSKKITERCLAVYYYLFDPNQGYRVRNGGQVCVFELLVLLSFYELSVSLV